MVGLASASAGAWKRSEALGWRVVQASPKKKGESSLGTTDAGTLDLLRRQMGVSGVAHPLQPLTQAEAMPVAILGPGH